jgi:DNA-binding MarR family transcriptional regulator
MGERLMIHPTSVTNIVDRLEEQGLVARTPHPTDRRTTLCEITAAGRAAVDAATVAVTDVEFGFGGLSATDIERLTAIVGRFRVAHEDFR